MSQTDPRWGVARVKIELENSMGQIAEYEFFEIELLTQADCSISVLPQETLRLSLGSSDELPRLSPDRIVLRIQGLLRHDDTGRTHLVKVRNKNG